jgi:L,D-transpeptidase YcbB
VFKGFGGPEVDANEIDWSSAIADDYHFRQEPGPANAMATAKINFASPFGIYLHDTPEKHLFKSGKRFYSSGCVRVEKVDKLMEWILNGQEGIGSSEIAALAETLERRDVKLTAPPQLRVTYLTAWPVGKTVAFRSDVYDLDSSGFVVGQPMPVGEVSDEGQRFVLKPIPRKPGQVEDAEAEGFGLFGGGTAGGKKRKPVKAKNLFDDQAEGVNDDGVVLIDNSKRKSLFAPTRKPAVKNAGFDEGDVDGVAAPKPVVKKDPKSAKAKPEKKFPGLFDWESYRKKQKDKSAAKADKKKVTVKKTETKVAAATPKDKKSIADKKAADKADPKKAAEKKVADNCKADAAGKLPKGCKAPTPKKP